MTTPPGKPANESDCCNLEKEVLPVLDGEPDQPSRVTMVKPVTSGVRRLSIISERDPDGLDTAVSSQDPLGASEWAGSSSSLCSDNMYTSCSSRFSSHDSHQPDSGDDCAAVLLACLHCRFHELVVLLPDTCERAVIRCFPSFKYVQASSEKEQQGGDWCSNLRLDCSGFYGSCQDTADLLELAMEVSEMCYR